MTLTNLARGGRMNSIAGNAAKAKRNAESRNGGASISPYLIAMKVSPQTVAIASPRTRSMSRIGTSVGVAA